MGDLHTYYSGIHADGANAVWNVLVAMPKGKERVLEDFSSRAEITWPHLTTGFLSIAHPCPLAWVELRSQVGFRSLLVRRYFTSSR